MSEDEGSSGEGGGGVSAVRLIGLVAREYSIPPDRVLELSWQLFLALLDDYVIRMREQEKEYKKGPGGNEFSKYPDVPTTKQVGR